MTQRTRACFVATASAAALFAPVISIAASTPTGAAQADEVRCTYHLKNDLILRTHKSVKSTATGTLKRGYTTQRSCTLPTGGHFKGCGGGHRWVYIHKRHAWAPMSGGCWSVKTSA